MWGYHKNKTMDVSQESSSKTQRGLEPKWLRIRGEIMFLFGGSYLFCRGALFLFVGKCCELFLLAGSMLCLRAVSFFVGGEHDLFARILFVRSFW